MNKTCEQNVPGRVAKAADQTLKPLPGGNASTFTKSRHVLADKPNAEETAHPMAPREEIKAPLTPVFAEDGVKPPLSAAKDDNLTSKQMQQEQPTQGKTPNPQQQQPQNPQPKQTEPGKDEIKRK